MKFSKKGICGIVAAMLMMSLMPPVDVQAKEDLTITANINKDLEIPLTLDASTEDFYMKGNLNPGDIMSADVVFKNVSTEPIQVRIADVTDQLNTTLSKKLLEVLDLEIEVDGSPVYKGKHDKVTNPLTQWITLNSNEEMTMKIRVEFSKYEADNTFQGAEMKVKYAFEARADVPLDEETEAPSTSIMKNPEKIKTGVDDVSSSNPVAIVISVAAVAIVGGFVIYTIASKKKKNDED